MFKAFQRLATSQSTFHRQWGVIKDYRVSIKINYTIRKNIMVAVNSMDRRKMMETRDALGHDSRVCWFGGCCKMTQWQTCLIVFSPKPCHRQQWQCTDLQEQHLQELADRFKWEWKGSKMTLWFLTQMNGDETLDMNGLNKVVWRTALTCPQGRKASGNVWL